MLLLARTTPLDEVEQADRRPLGVPRRHARAAGDAADDPADRDDDEPRHDRGLLRRPARCRPSPDRRGGQGLPLHPRRHERRADPDRGRVHRRRPLVRRARPRATRRSASCSAARSARTRACSSRSRGPRGDRGGRPDALQGGLAVRAGRAVRRPRRTWRSCSPRRPRGRPRTRAWTRTAASASPREYDVERKFRETRLYQVAPVSTNLVLAYLGQHVLGMPRSY